MSCINIANQFTEIILKIVIYWIMKLLIIIEFSILRWLSLILIPLPVFELLDKMVELIISTAELFEILIQWKLII